MTVALASKKDRDELCALWKVCFADTDEYINGFFDNRFNPDETLVLREDGAVRSMLFLLPGALKIGARQFKAAYLYAACTQPEYRARGYMGTLLESAGEICIRRGLDFICLKPAQESLFLYYAKYGYISAFEEKTLFLSRRQLKAVAAQSAQTGGLCAGDMQAVRDELLYGCDCFIWDEAALQYAILENRLAGAGEVACFENGRCAAYALFYQEGEKLIIKECAACKGSFNLLARALLDSCGCDVFFFRLPLSFPLSSDSFKTGRNAMLLPLSEQAGNAVGCIQNAYMGLCLD